MNYSEIKKSFERIAQKGAVVWLLCVVLAGSLYSCGKSSENILLEPTEIPITELVLHSFCSWRQSSSGQYIENSVIIINSNEELEKRFGCYNIDFDYFPEIDFSRHTLLYADGASDCCNSFVVEYTFLQNGKNKYTLNITHMTGPLAAVVPWQIGLLTTKIANNSQIKLNVKEISYQY